MKNIELLLKPSLVKKTPKKVYTIKNTIKDRQGSSLINGLAFARIVNQVNNIILLDIKEGIHIEFKLGNVFFRDKATYVLFECLIYVLLRDYNVKITLLINPKIKGFYYGDIKKSLTYKYSNRIINKETFLNEFMTFNSDLAYYRKILINKDDSKKNGVSLSRLESDLILLFKQNIKDEEYCENMAEAIAEMAGNALEHGESDCLVDINIQDIYKGNDQSKKYISLDVVIVNFGHKLLGDGIKEKLEHDNFEDSPKVKETLKEALNNHKIKFSDNYCYEDFCICSSFQWRVSSRKDSSDNTGGTGLTTVMENLIDKSQNEYCYVYSGRNIIYFKNGLITPKNGLIGFNKECDFLNSTPDRVSIDKCPYYLNGTLYNLNFIKEKEGDEYEYDRTKI